VQTADSDLTEDWPVAGAADPESIASASNPGGG
jgi:hypothetical protein